MLCSKEKNAFEGASSLSTFNLDLIAAPLYLYSSSVSNSCLKASVSGVSSSF